MAGNSKFNVDITAKNKTAEGVRAAKKEFEGLTKPVGILEQATGKFAKGSGLGDLVQGMGGLRKSVLDAFGGMGDAAEAAGVLGGATAAAATGVGILGVALGAAAVGSVKFAGNIAGAATEIGRTSKLLGISTRDLQEFRGAAELNGVSAEAMTGALQNVGNTLNDARWGRNNQALQLMNQLGIRTHYTKDGLIDTKRAMLDIANALQRNTNPQTQEMIAKVFGADAALSMLRRGARAVQGDMAQYAASGAEFTDAQINQSTQFSRSLTQLHNQWQGLKHDLAEKVVIPWTQPLIADLGKALDLLDQMVNGKKKPSQVVVEQAAKHKQALAAALPFFGPGAGLLGGVLGGGGGMLNATRDAELGIGKAITDWFDQHQDAFANAWWMKGGGFGGNITPASYSRGGGIIADRGPAVAGAGFRKAYGFFREQGWSQAQAAGIAQNLVDESGVSPNPAGSNDGGRAYGAAQWHGPRQQDFARWAGHSIVGSSLDEQLRFIEFELTQGKYAGVGQKLSAAQTAAQAAALISQFYEVPAAGAPEAAARGRRAEDALNSLGAGGSAGKVDVNVRIRTDQPAAVLTRASGAVRATAGVEHSLSSVA